MTSQPDPAPGSVAVCFVNDRAESTSAPPGAITLDVLRDRERLVGTREGCREGDCGSCTVLLGELDGGDVRYRAVCACLLPFGDVQGGHLVTVEGLSTASGLTPVQRLLVEEGGVQCGFCTPGFVVSLTGYLLACSRPQADDAVESIDGNLCRCTGHVPIVRAAGRLVDTLGSGADPDADRLSALIDAGMVPAYFADVPDRLRTIPPHPEVAPPVTGPVVDPAVPLVAGGTDSYVGNASALTTGSVQRISGWQVGATVTEEDTGLRIPATLTIEDLRRSPVIRRHLPDIVSALELFGSAQIRNRATVGGNLVTASPIADLTCLLMGLDATVVLREGTAIREVPLHDFYLGYKHLAKRPTELVDAVVVPRLSPTTRVSFEKVSRRRHLDVASVNSTLVADVHDGVLSHVQVTVGGVAPTMLLLPGTSAALEGSRPGPDVLARANAVAQSEISPISDVRGNAAYKRLLVRQLLAAHLERLAPGALTPQVLP